MKAKPERVKYFKELVQYMPIKRNTSSTMRRALAKFDYLQTRGEAAFSGLINLAGFRSELHQQIREGASAEECFKLWNGPLVKAMNTALILERKRPLTERELRAYFFQGLK